MASEAKRGCGYRKVGGLYLCGEGIWVGCDRIPFPVGACPVCGEGVHFPRSPKQVNPVKLFGNHSGYCRDCGGSGVIVGGNPVVVVGYKCPVCGGSGKQECKDNFVCHVCAPKAEVAFLLGVGEKFYKPEEFLMEAQTMGISKRIHAIPKNLKLGETWVYLVHKKAIASGIAETGEPLFGSAGIETRKMSYGMAIFAAFKPRAVEKLVWKSAPDLEKVKLRERGISVVEIPDGDLDHI